MPTLLPRRQVLALLAATALPLAAIGPASARSAAAQSAAAQPAAALPGAGADLRFILLADLHSAYERLAQLLAAVEAERARLPDVPTLVVVNGDVFELGNVVAARSKGEADWAFLARLAAAGPVVLNIGNHEGDLVDDLAEVVTRARGLGITVLSNIVDARTGQPYAPHAAEFTLGRRKVAVAALATNALNTYPKAQRPTLTIPDPVAWAKANLPALTAGRDVNLVLSHAGVGPDKAILPLLPDGTLLVGGHDHLVFRHDAGATRYVHTGSWSRGFAVAAVTGATIDLAQVAVGLDAPKDAALAASIDALLSKHLTDAERAVVARSPKALGLDDTGRAVAAMIAAAHGGDVGLVGHTTFGTGLPAGPVSRYVFDSVVRFEGKLMRAEVSADDLKRLYAVANQDRDMPLDARMGDYVYASEVAIDPGRRYVVVTNDWTVINRKAYLGRDDLAFQPIPDALLKPTVLAALH
jgi:2',3'-cyclic-nucleotide 2'-phosphodiesterase (5'-nucleotidase family)